MTERAIIEYVNLLSSTKISGISDLCSGQVFCNLVSLIKPCKIDMSKVGVADNWLPKLSNLRLALKALETYSEDEIGNKLDTGGLDLLNIAKFEKEEEVLKFFEILLNVFMNCRNKEDFINKILKMEEESKHQITEIVKKMLQPKETEDHERIHRSSSTEATLLEKLDQLEHEIDTLKQEKVRLTEKNKEKQKENQFLYEQISKLNATITSLGGELSERDLKSPHLEIFDHSSLVQSLKEKLITQSVQHQKQKMRMGEQIELMRVKLEKIDDVEDRAEIYLQRVNALSEKVAELEENLLNAKDELARKDQLMGRLEDKNRLLSEKSNKEELERISLQVDVQRQNVRNTRNDEAKKTVSTEHSVSDTVLQDYSKRQSEEELAIANRRIRTLEKQLAKSNLKAEKASKLQADKKQLQEAFVVELNSRKQQLQILSSALIEIRLQHLNCGCRK